MSISANTTLNENNQLAHDISKQAYTELNPTNFLDEVSFIGDYELIKEIGQGSFGFTCLAKKQTSSKQFVLKITEKSQIQKFKSKTEETLVERDLLSMCNHPSVIKLLSSFQTKTFLCYVMELAPNQDLAIVLKKCSILPYDLAQFYSAELLNVIEYLHCEKNITHNSLMPMNMMLDENYHLKLINFSKAKINGKRYNFAKKKFIDSALTESNLPEIVEYSSPELLNQTITDFRSNDIWAFGCVLYTFYHGRTPFKGETHDITLANIKEGRYSIKKSIPGNLKDLLKDIFIVNPKNRIGCRREFNGLNEIKSHSYYNGVDWDNITNSEVPLTDEFLNQLGCKLRSTDRNSISWKKICKKINDSNEDQYTINKLSSHSSIDAYFFDKILHRNESDNSASNESCKVVYEGTVSKSGIIKSTTIKIKLMSNKKLEVYKKKKNAPNKVIDLSRASVSIKSGFITIQYDTKKLCFKAKEDLHLLYQYINSMIMKVIS